VDNCFKENRDKYVLGMCGCADAEKSGERNQDWFPYWLDTVGHKGKTFCMYVKKYNYTVGHMSLKKVFANIIVIIASQNVKDCSHSEEKKRLHLARIG